MNGESCDYCHEDTEGNGFLRAIGFVRLSAAGPEMPQARFWCGKCDTDDEVDTKAHHAMMRAFRRQLDDQR